MKSFQGTKRLAKEKQIELIVSKRMNTNREGDKHELKEQLNTKIQLLQPPLQHFHVNYYSLFTVIVFNKSVSEANFSKNKRNIDESRKQWTQESSNTMEST